MKLFVILMFFTGMVCNAQTDLIVKISYDKVCNGKYSDKFEITIDSCKAETGEFEFDKTFVKHNEVTYLVEQKELIDNVGVSMYTMGPNFSNVLFLLSYDIETKKRVIYKTANLADKTAKFKIYYPLDSKVYIRLNVVNEN